MNFSHDEFATISSLNLDPIKIKLMHKESGEGWPLERADAVEFEYRRYLYLMKKFPQEQAAPSVDVDTFWHYHILDTCKYAEDCQAVFGYFLHHFPYIGLQGDDDLIVHQRVGQRMRFLYEETFGEVYPFSADDHEDSPAEIFFSMKESSSAYCMRPPSTAYCMKPPSTAYCMKPPSTAYCMKPPGTAYCMQPPDTAFAMKASSAALSLIRPRLPEQAVN
jgi:hypothetical protein